jgi:hypothetical protein
MKAVELAVSLKGCWRNIAISLIDPRKGVLSVIACLRQSTPDLRDIQVIGNNSG